MLSKFLTSSSSSSSWIVALQSDELLSKQEWETKPSQGQTWTFWQERKGIRENMRHGWEGGREQEKNGGEIRRYRENSLEFMVWGVVEGVGGGGGGVVVSDDSNDDDDMYNFSLSFFYASTFYYYISYAYKSSVPMATFVNYCCAQKGWIFVFLSMKCKF